MSTRQKKNLLSTGGCLELCVKRKDFCFVMRELTADRLKFLKCVYGEAVQDGDAYRMIYGTKKHHFTGKSQEWNEAFEEFITGKGTRETPMIWTVFGEEELEEYTFEIEVKASTIIRSHFQYGTTILRQMQGAMSQRIVNGL